MSCVVTKNPEPNWARCGVEGGPQGYPMAMSGASVFVRLDSRYPTRNAAGGSTRVSRHAANGRTEGGPGRAGASRSRAPSNPTPSRCVLAPGHPPLRLSHPIAGPMPTVALPGINDLRPRGYPSAIPRRPIDGSRVRRADTLSRSRRRRSMTTRSDGALGSGGEQAARWGGREKTRPHGGWSRLRVHDSGPGSLQPDSVSMLHRTGPSSAAATHLYCTAGASS